MYINNERNNTSLKNERIYGKILETPINSLYKRMVSGIFTISLINKGEFECF